MPQNFIESRREQGFLLPPDVRDWLAADHLAWFLIDAVGQMDLSAFYGAYRADGHGRAAYEPSVMVTLVLYAFATDVRSSRAIERHCRQDVAYRVIAGNVVPDHATIARFIVRHQDALAGLFSEVLRLCDQAGLVKPGVVAIDGTRLAGNASRERNHEFGKIAEEIIEQVRATDAAEDEMLGEARGDELPEPLRTPEGRREFFRKVRRKLVGEHDGEELAEAPEADASAEPEFEFDPERILARVQGRKGWLRDAERQLEQDRWEDPDPVGRARSERLLLAAERLEADLAAERAGNEAFEHHRVHGRDAQGRRLAGTPTPYEPPEVPAGRVNVTDPDSKLIKASEGYVQGYNAQAVVDGGQIVLAAEITNSTVDWSQLAPMVDATLAELARAGSAGRLETAVADTQYWNEQHMDEVTANRHVQVLIPPDGGASGKQRKGWTGGRYSWMRYVLNCEVGEQLYRKRKQMIEPVFGHSRHNRGVTRFLRRGRKAVRTEWRLMMMTHNLTKLHRHQIATVGA
ncbi:MAG: transposase [Solirubrobacterales bacterium]|nr:transposase [Solirubrobacterales bacterium]